MWVQDGYVVLLHGLPDDIPENKDGLFAPAWINDKTLAGTPPVARCVHAHITQRCGPAPLPTSARRRCWRICLTVLRTPTCSASWSSR